MPKTGFFLNYVLIALSLLFSGCSSTVKTVDYAYQPQGVQLEVTAPAKLNYYERQAHALLLAVIQAEQLDPLYPSLTSRDGLVNLLSNSTNKFVLQRIFIQPNDHRLIAFDRNAKTQALVFLTGYADLLPAQSSTIVNIPVKKSHSGLLWLKTTYRAALVYVYVDLGQQGIVNVRACDEPLAPKETCSENLIQSTSLVTMPD